jgi:pimeloyl-ACP methyl ester carboxylesterase
MDSFRRGDLVFDVLDTGPADGPVVVLLHGFPQRADSWAQVAARLTAEGYRCVAPDQRGYSPRARPRGRVPELVADVLALVDATGAERVHLVGHDWGAAVAWAFAAEHPERLASLSALSVPHPAGFLRAMVTSRQLLASWYMYAFQLPALPEGLLVGRRGAGWSRFARFLRATGQSAAAAERDARAMAEPDALRGGLGWYRAVPLADPRSQDATVAVPSLLVWSDGDSAVLRKGVDACASWVSGPYRLEVLHGVSHWIPDEAPDAAADLLLEQLRAYPV